MIKWFGLGAILLASCTEKVVSPQYMETYPSIYPDYTEVTIPSTIAPLNFDVTGDDYERVDVVVQGVRGESLHVNGKTVSFDESDWHKLLHDNIGDSLMFTVSVKRNGKWVQYQSFPMYVSTYPIDYGLVYRLIAPGYEVYSKMGIYQRDLSSFNEEALIENTLVHL